MQYPYGVDTAGHPPSNNILTLNILTKDLTYYLYLDLCLVYRSVQAKLLLRCIRGVVRGASKTIQRRGRDGAFTRRGITKRE